jgi:hypothetical protein
MKIPCGDHFALDYANQMFQNFPSLLPKMEKDNSSLVKTNFKINGLKIIPESCIELQINYSTFCIIHFVE